MLKSKSIQIALLVTLIATLLSFAKFNHCHGTNWASPDVYIHMCYSDISALYGARQIDTDKWPYASADNSLEYPVLTGVVTYLTGLLIDDPNSNSTIKKAFKSKYARYPFGSSISSPVK